MRIPSLFLLLCALAPWAGLGCKTTEGNQCIKDQDCRSSLKCIQRVCSNLATMEKKADEYCKQTKECEQKGLCSARAGQCMALHDSDCHRSDACIEHGRCRARHGKCME